MGRAIEVVTPPTPVVVEEPPPSPVEGPPGPRTLISLEQLEQVHAAESAAERAQQLQSALGVQHYPVNPRTCVWVDFCFGVLNFARDDARLTPQKTLALLTLAHVVYTFATDPAIDRDLSVSKISEPVPPYPQESTQSQEDVVPALLDSYPSVETVYEHFREKIRQASVARIVTYFTSTFFRHVRAYQYLNRVQRPSVMRECPLSTETPLPPPSLADATLQPE
ncbi:uncharacterized protein PITG_06648 [Phytophthora infestans T30-4]|uniref:Uncharacterized protein n=1 Tax=Phytophthora infestans (strain T30-4) TaxID=403677 RepID=D0N5C1_PHYIT|nr:uncharacterized protein PITG_06648 [Phytophthora infestans T30-4]EEY70079.1 conserved hypothetical protein [Phytophthora infestans T30-4]|eukprot:XP_002998726.1 conserved hypothetical protein [Phytophthora infestans T30-4]